MYFSDFICNSRLKYDKMEETDERINKRTEYSWKPEI